MAENPSTHLVLLGTGTPNADPERSGPGVAVVVGSQAYLVDFGPGIVRRAAAATHNGIKALAPENLTIAFLTHLHSDHTAGYPDLILTPWVLERTAPLQVFGPPGTGKMTKNLLKAYQADIQERLSGLEPANEEGYQVDVTEIKSGKVYQDDRVTVEAFTANHGSWPAYSFRFTTPEGVITISGDTAPYPGVEDNYKGCDILLHEVYSARGLSGRPPSWQRYHKAVHTSSHELAAIAQNACPGLLVLYHQLFWGATAMELEQEIRSQYTGNVVSGKDLDVFSLPLEEPDPGG